MIASRTDNVALPVSKKKVSKRGSLGKDHGSLATPLDSVRGYLYS